MARFSKCPTWWVRGGLLKDAFPSGKHAGESIAGLKCLIAISHSVNFHSLATTLSYSELEKATGLSKPMVAKGISLLERNGIIHIDRGYKNTYTLLESLSDSGWAKLPVDFLKKELPSMPNRGRVSLFALKFYLQLLADRPNNSPVMHMTYETISQKVGTQTRDIKPSIDILFNHNLISVSRTETHFMDKTIVYKKNEYHIRGL